MSWKASAWAKEQRLGSPAAKSILLCLADYADPDNAECWPSQTQLAGDAEVSERTAREWLQRLEEWGLIQRTRRTRATGARASDMIALNLDIRVRDGADRCRELKADAADIDMNLPAEFAGRTNRQPDAEPTGNQQQPTGNQCRAYKEEPSIEPPNGTSQGAREGARESLKPEDRKKIENAGWALLKDWPGFAGMPKESAMKAWLGLSDQDRADATRLFPHWLTLLKAQKKTHTPAPSTYFGQRLWADVPEPQEVKPTSIEARPFGPVWMAARLKQLRAGPTMRVGLTSSLRAMVAEGKANEADLLRANQAQTGFPAVNFMHDQASSRRGISAAPALEAFAAMMEAVPVGSAVYDQWRAFHERMGWPWLPDPGDQRVVYFPAGGPDMGMKAFEIAVQGNEEKNNDGGAREAAE